MMAAKLFVIDSAAMARSNVETAKLNVIEK